MRRLFFLLSACLTCNHLLALPSFDPFADATANGGTTYAVGSALTNQVLSPGSPWNTLGAVNGANAVEPTIVAGNLTYSNLPPSTGNSVGFYSAVAKGARLNLNGVIVGPAAKAFYSYILKITDIANVPTNAINNYFAGFSDGTVGQMNALARVGTRVVTKKVGGGFVLGVSKTANTADMIYDTNVFNVNDVIFLVGSYEVVSGVSNCNLWINPPLSTFGSNAAPAPTLSTSAHSGGNSALNASGVAAFAINCQSAFAPVGMIDELRVGTTWTFVTGGDPAVLQNPSNQTLPPGSNATFSVTARGTATLGYQWIKDGTTILTDGGSISGATTSNLVLTAISPGDAGSYVAVVTNGLGNSVTSSPAILTVVDPAVITPPQSRTDDYGSNATFSVTAAGTAPLSYQWQKNGADLPNGGNVSGTTTTNLTVSAVTYLDAGGYSVVVSNGLGNSVTSSIATLTVRDPAITSPPASRTNNAGTTATFSAAAMGTPTIGYQWKHENTLLVNGGNISGADTDTLTLASVSPGDAGNYFAVASGSASGLSVTSAPAILTVIDLVAIYSQPASRTVFAGQNVTFAVGVTGTSPSYQWRSNDVPISGATSASYSLANVQTSFAASYSVVITNILNAVTSAPAVLTISQTALRLYDTNVAVIRVGNGAQALTANGNSMFLDQFTPSGSYVSTHNIPDNGPSALITMGPNSVPSPSSVTGTGLSRSADGRFLVVAGYNTNLSNSVALHNVTAAAVPRGVGLIDAGAQYSLGLASTDSVFSATFWRSAVTDGTNNYWGAARIGGTYYFGFDDPAATIQTVFSNMRGMALFNGSIYCIAAVANNDGVLKLDGMPHTAAGSNPTVLIDEAAGASTGSSDCEVSPDGNLIYVADDRNTPNGGIQRYEFTNSVWTRVYTLTSGLATGARYVTADFRGTNPIVYAITREATDENNRIVVIEDTGAASVGTTVVAAGANQNFRGIRFGPSASTALARPTLFFTREGGDLILSWSGPFVLQSATNVTGAYSDVSAATSPHTNSTASADQRYFRLRN